jgi:tetratricopeptide (TPR) repeat protein
MEALGERPSVTAVAADVPLVGREEEVRVLRRTAQAVRDGGQARIVTLVGPNGVGKTTIINQALRELLADPGRRFRIYRGTPKDSSLGHGALASLLRNRFGLVEGASLDDAHAQIRAQVSKVLDDRKVGDVCFFIGQILDIPFPDSPLTKALRDDPQEGRLLRRAIIKNFFESDAARGPICLVFDDLDAAGEDSIGLVSYLVEHLAGPVLIVCSMRPEMLSRHSTWGALGGARHQRLDVGPVGTDVAREIMRALLAPCEGGAPEALVDAGVRVAGGNVGLLQAMVRLFHDAGVLEEEGALARDPLWRVHLDKLESVRLPVTVEDTVSMRIAALSPTEQVLLERAAAMGSVFWVGALVALERTRRKVPAVWEIEPESELESIEALLASLEQRDYVVRVPSSSFAGEAQYAFKHKLERQRLAALTAEDVKRAYHQTIADWLRHRQPERPTREHLALLAYHLDCARSTTLAGLAYLDAADAARSAYAARDAQEHYERGLALLGDADAQRRIDALHNHGDVLSTLGRTDEALAAFREMLALAYRLDLRAKGGAAHNRIGRLCRATGSLVEAQVHLETALALFASAGDERGVAACHDDVGMLLWTKGEYEQALERMRTALEMRKTIGDRRSIALSLHNIGVVFRDHGRPAQAREALEASLQIRRELDDRIGVAQTLDSLGRLAQDQLELTQARDLFRQAYDVAREVGERNWIAIVLTNLGETEYRLGDADLAIRILTEAEELCDELGDKLHLAEAKRGLALVYLMQGDLKKARTNIKHAVDLLGQIRSKSHLAAALRTLGEITAAGAWGPAHEGKSIDYFMRSIALCKEIGNEIEIAKSYTSFSDYVARSRHYKDNERIQREATKLRTMAEEIFARRIHAERAEA